MTIVERQALQTEYADERGAHWIGTTEPNRAEWRPVTVLREDGASALSEQPTYAGTQEGQEDLRLSVSALDAEIRKLDESALERQFTTARGSMSGYRVIGLGAHPMAFHGGAVKFMQVLTGDGAFRVLEK